MSTNNVMTTLGTEWYSDVA